MDTQIKKQSILIIEDDIPELNALRDKFAREGFVVLEAKNGKQGIEVALREHPDLILLDIVMPVMDGMTMLKKLRSENEWGKSVPVVLLTNLSADDDKIMREIAETEPAYYLVKSNWTINEVVEKVRERLARVV